MEEKGNIYSIFIYMKRYEKKREDDRDYYHIINEEY